MSSVETTGADYQLAGDDVVVPFAVAPLDVRGRAIQVGSLLDTILKRHNYPHDVGFLLGELIVLNIILGSSLKFDGNFILQTQSDGPVSLVVVDFSTPGSVRAYARFDEAAVEKAAAEGKATPRELLGNGVMALTIDQGPEMQRYQGVVELDGITLEEVAHQYFRQSEQIPTRVRLAVAQIMRAGEGDGPVETSWRAGGLITQFLPDTPGRVVTQDLPGGSGEDEEEVPVDDAWVEASSLVDTISDDELTDPNISAERLLYRLYNEHGVRVFDGIPVEESCPCSREKVIALVKNFEDEEDGSSEKREDFTTTCEFCSTVYEISANEIYGD
ncbi:MAG: Hsp33 family molecular chaperone [Pseudomonadota bacterium]